MTGLRPLYRPIRLLGPGSIPKKVLRKKLPEEAVASFSKAATHENQHNLHYIRAC